MDTEFLPALAAVLDPLFLLTLGGSLAFLWGLWRVLVDDVDIRGGERPETDRP